LSVTKLQGNRQKVRARIDSLLIMNTKTNQWRERFLQIAREAQAELARPKSRPTGLRPRSRMAGFATLRRGPRLSGAPRLA
jgi:hypothetical protein